MEFLTRFKSVLDVTSTLMAIAAAGAVMWTVGLRSQPKASAVEEVDGLQIESSTITNTLGTGPVALVEFSDFQCPYCQRFSSDVWPLLKKTLIDSGRARYIALQFPLEQIHPLALAAGEAAECAGRQGRFWDMRERLFTPNGALAAADLIEHSRQLDLREDVFKKCIEGDETLQAIRVDQEQGKRLGVNGTPTLFTGIVQSDGSIRLVERIRGLGTADFIIQRVNRLTQREGL